MNLAWLFFSFSGRINRAKYWYAGFALVAAFVLAILIVVVTKWYVFGEYFIMVLFLSIVFSTLALVIKRLHDRGKSAWWLLIFYVLPAVIQWFGDTFGGAALLFYWLAFGISVWAFVELGFIRGTVGPNRFGSDPLAPTI